MNTTIGAYVGGLVIDPKRSIYLQNLELLSDYSGILKEDLKEAVRGWSRCDPHLASQLIVMPFVFQFGPFFFNKRGRYPTLGEAQRCLRIYIGSYVDDTFLEKMSQAYTIRKYASKVAEWQKLLNLRVGALKQTEILSSEEEALEVGAFHHYIRQKYLGDDKVEDFIKYVLSGSDNEFITSMAVKCMHNFRNQQQ